MKVLTLTLNPAYDIHCYARDFKLYRENLAKITSRDAGGKGINIGRALCAWGVSAKNLVVLGDESAEDFLSLLEREGLEVVPIIIPGRIRENLTISTEGAPETRISFAGFTADDGLLWRVLGQIGSDIREGDVVTFSGRLPEGVTKAGAMRLLLKLKSLGARLAVDTHAFDREDIIALSPWLIKPNAEEMEKYLGKCENAEQIGESARRLCECGVENVMVSLGKDGAILATGGEIVCMSAPSVAVASTVGAGDSSIAGFIAAVLEGASPKDSLRTAVAFGSAACTTEGTSAPSKEDIDKLLCKI